MFEYACNRRHPDAGGAPPGYLLRSTDHVGKYGTVGYEDHLDAETVSRYGLVLVTGPYGQWKVYATKVESGERVYLAQYHGTGAAVFFRAQREAVHRQWVVKDMELEWVGK